ncbi:cell division protein FtsA [Candidatus Falkowbacteria bacterium]|nr:cell division protein FtsA [Candidatus Falkowbacteria bacterium]
MHEDIIVGIDVGSTKVRIAVGQRTYTEESKIPHLSIVGFVEEDSAGVNRGVITNVDDAVRAISKAIDKAEKSTGLPLETAWVSVNGSHIMSQVHRGIVAVQKVDGEIMQDDVMRSLEAAKTLSIPPNYEIIHVVPRAFAVDGQEGIKDPIGMNGRRLEVDAFIIEGMKSQINNLTKSVYMSALDIEDIVVNPLACAEVVVTSKQKELGGCVLNIGSSTTSIAVYEQGELLHVRVLPIGSEHITSDIAIGLRTSLEVAESIKLTYGNAVVDAMVKGREISLSEFDPSEEGSVSLEYVCEIIAARTEEIFEKVDEVLEDISRDASLPGGVILCGGGARLPRIVEVAKQTLKMSATLGYPSNIAAVVDSVHDVAATCAVGLVKWGDMMTQSIHGGFSKYKSIKNVTNQMKKWFGSLMP